MLRLASSKIIFVSSSNEDGDCFGVGALLDEEVAIMVPNPISLREESVRFEIDYKSRRRTTRREIGGKEKEEKEEAYRPLSLASGYFQKRKDRRTWIW
jgi:hypothetical protein